MAISASAPLSVDDRLPPESAASRAAALAAAQGRPLKPPATCSYCGMTFKKLEHCQRHERTHTHDRPYPCSVCAKTFARQDTLNRHVRLHTRGDDGFGLQSPKSPKKRPRVKSASVSLSAAAHSKLGHQRANSDGTVMLAMGSTQSSPHLKPLFRHRGFSLDGIDEHQQQSHLLWKQLTTYATKEEEPQQASADVSAVPSQNHPTMPSPSLFTASAPPPATSSYTGSDCDAARGWNAPWGGSLFGSLSTPSPFSLLAQPDDPAMAYLVGAATSEPIFPPTQEHLGIHDNAFGLVGVQQEAQLPLDPPRVQGTAASTYFPPKIEEDEGWPMFFNDLDSRSRHAAVNTSVKVKDEHGCQSAQWSSGLNSVTLDHNHMLPTRHSASPQELTASPSDASSAQGAGSDSLSSFASQGFGPHIFGKSMLHAYPNVLFQSDAEDTSSSYVSAYSARPSTTGQDSLASSLQTDVSWCSSPQHPIHPDQGDSRSRSTSADQCQEEQLSPPKFEFDNLPHTSVIMEHDRPMPPQLIGMPSALAYIDFKSGERSKKTRHRHRPPSLSLSERSLNLTSSSPLYDTSSISPSLKSACPPLSSGGEAGLVEDWRRVLDFHMGHQQHQSCHLLGGYQQGVQQENFFGGCVDDSDKALDSVSLDNQHSLFFKSSLSSMSFHGLQTNNSQTQHHRHEAYAHGEPEIAVEILGSPAPDPLMSVFMGRSSGRAVTNESAGYPLTPEKSP